MARPLSWRDWLAIRSLQKRGEQLDLERAWLGHSSPLVAALSASFPFLPLGAETFVTFTQNSHTRTAGMLQARLCPRRPEGVITFIAPALAQTDDAAPIWYRLINELVQSVGERGVQRLYAQTAREPRVEQVLNQGGFTTYAHEDIFRLAVPPLSPAPKLTLQPQRPRDAWNLMRLYQQTTPRPVQQAEGVTLPEDENKARRANINWDPRMHGSGYVMYDGDKFVGALRLARGPSGYWLRFWLNPDAQAQANTLVNAALKLLRVSSDHPVYIPVREYDSHSRPLLYELGFQCTLTRSLLVKHTTARVKEALPQLTPAFEKAAPLINAHLNKLEINV